MTAAGAMERHVDRFQELFLAAVARPPPPHPLFPGEVGVLSRGLPVRGPAVPAAAPRELAACIHLPRAVAEGLAGAEAGLIEAVAGLAPALHWTYSYPADGRYPGLAERIAFCEVVGLRGLRPAGTVRLGLTLMAPGTAYPLHAHPAVETYLVISGTGLWQAGDGEPALRPPGSIVWHPAGIPHAMTSFAEPLLAVWSWTGEIGVPPAYTA